MSGLSGRCREIQLHAGDPHRRQRGEHRIVDRVIDPRERLIASLVKRVSGS